MMMANPVPYNQDTLDNSPLSPSGSNYPCHVPAGSSYKVTKMNNIAVGQAAPLEFKGSAVHGGGSCQIAITTDKNPTADSRFKVIKSFIGGCPTPGDSPSPFNFTLPAIVPNGEMTLAWTWFNHVGNREFYMNCAPVTVSGGADDAAGMDALPDMFKANIAGTDCKTPESADPVFPDPGKDVETRGSGPFATDLPGCGASAPVASSSASVTGSNDGMYTAFGSSTTASSLVVPSVPAKSTKVITIIQTVYPSSEISTSITTPQSILIT
jgi:hypothetical protein